MKSRFISLLLLLSYLCQGQDIGTFHGFSVGGGIATLRGTGIIGNSNTTSQTYTPIPVLNFGITMFRPLNNHFGFGCNVNYEQKGFASNGTMNLSGNNVGFSNYINFHSLSVPIFLMIYTHLHKHISFSINMGGYVGYIFHIDQEGQINNIPEQVPYAQTGTRLDGGLILGGRLFFHINNSRRLFVELRNNYGLANMNSTFNGSLHNISQLIIIGYCARYVKPNVVHQKQETQSRRHFHL